MELISLEIGRAIVSSESEMVESEIRNGSERTNVVG